jgi:hypothetical protein
MDTAVICQPVEQPFYGNTIQRMYNIGGYFIQWNKNKTPEMELRMRNAEIFFPDDFLPVEENIKVNDPWPPFYPTFPSHPGFYVLEHLQQDIRGMTCPYLGDTIDEPVLRRHSYGFRSVQ